LEGKIDMRYLIIFILLIGVLPAQSGYDIAKLVDERLGPRDLTNKTNMVLTNSRGKTRTYTMISKSMDVNKKQIIWFLEPKDDKGVAFLKIEHDDKDDEMRMWLPAFKKVRRISSKKKGDAFMGSDLSYEDLSSRELNENDYNRMEDEPVNGIDCYVLEIIPKKKAKSSYKKHISWVDKSTLTTVKEHSFNKRGRLHKEKEFQYGQMGEYQVMNRVFVKDKQNQHTTEVLFSDIKIDTGMDENLFHEKNLKRLPRN